MAQLAKHKFTKAEDLELFGYFHKARTALAFRPDANKRYNRLVWASGQFHRKHPKVDEGQAYLHLDKLTKKKYGTGR